MESCAVTETLFAILLTKITLLRQLKLSYLTACALPRDYKVFVLLHAMRIFSLIADDWSMLRRLCKLCVNALRRARAINQF